MNKILMALMAIMIVIGTVLTIPTMQAYAKPHDDPTPTPTVTPTPTPTPTPTYTLTYNAGNGGKIEGDTPQTVNKGQDGAPATAVPDECYRFVKWSDNKTSNPRTDTNVNKDITVTAIFAIKTYTIDASDERHGEISPEGDVRVDCGADKTFTITPDPGYQVDDVLVDGASVGAVTTYTFSNVKDNNSIHASFCESSAPTPTPTPSPTPTPDPKKAFTATITPDTAKAGETKEYTLKFEADSDNNTPIGHITAVIPTGFTDITTIEIKASGDKSWSGEIDSGKIALTANPGNYKLDADEYVSVRFSATAPLTAGSYEWTSDAYSGKGEGSAFTLLDSQPTVTVELNTTRLTADDASGTYGGTVDLTATLDPDISGATIDFTLDGDSVGSAVTDAGGVAKLTGVDISGIDVGNYNDYIGASFAGGSGYEGSSDRADLTVKKATAAVTLGSLSHTYDGTQKSATYTTDPAGLNVDLKYDGKSTPPTNAGDYEVEATIDDENYDGSANGTLVIARADAVIEVDGYTGTYDDNAHGAKLVSATGVGGADLSGSVKLGAKFTNVPGGSADWKF